MFSRVRQRARSTMNNSLSERYTQLLRNAALAIPIPALEGKERRPFLPSSLPSSLSSRPYFFGSFSESHIHSRDFLSSSRSTLVLLSRPAYFFHSSTAEYNTFPPFFLSYVLSEGGKGLRKLRSGTSEALFLSTL